VELNGKLQNSDLYASSEAPPPGPSDASGFGRLPRFNTFARGRKVPTDPNIVRKVLLLFKETSHINSFVREMDKFFDTKTGVVEYRCYTYMNILDKPSTKAFVFNDFFQVVLQCYREPMIDAAILFPDVTKRDVQPSMFSIEPNSL
jgi:hypothetical protein